MQLAGFLLLYLPVGLFHFATAISHCDEFENGNNYSAYESMLLAYDANLIELERGFFPTNYHSSVVVDVDYYFILADHLHKDNDSESNIEKTPFLSFTDTELSHHCFRWVISPINLFIRPGLLKSLSLNAYQTNNASINLYLFLPPKCFPEILNKTLNFSVDVCYHPPALLKQLNTLTANLQSYALHRSSILKNGLQLDKEKGFSVYFFEEDNPSDYCIIEQENSYSEQRFYMNVGVVILVFAIMLATPVTLVSVYDTFYKKMEGNMMYFVWSIVAVSFVVTVLMIFFDIKTVVLNIELYPKYKTDQGYNDIYKYFILLSAVLGVIITGDIVVMILALVNVRPIGDRKFPIPELFKFVKRLLSCFECCGSCKDCGRPEAESNTENVPLLVEEGKDQNHVDQEANKNKGFKLQQLCCSDCLVLLFGSVSFTLFLQLTSFHSVYILLGTISTPVETLSITSFYIATYFCLVAFIAVVLKSTDKKKYYIWKELKRSNLTKCSVVLLSAALFIIFFVIYFYNYTVMVQGYRNSGGIFGIVGSLLPSFLVAFGGWCGTRLIKCIKPKTDVTDAITSQQQPPSSEQPGSPANQTQSSSTLSNNTPLTPTPPNQQSSTPLASSNAKTQEVAVEIESTQNEPPPPPPQQPTTTPTISNT